MGVLPEDRLQDQGQMLVIQNYLIQPFINLGLISLIYPFYCLSASEMQACVRKYT